MESGTFGLERGQDVEVDEAQGVAVPALEDAAAIARRPRGHLVEELALEGRSVAGRGAGRLAPELRVALVRMSVLGAVDIQHEH